LPKLTFTVKIDVPEQTDPNDFKRKLRAYETPDWSFYHQVLDRVEDALFIAKRNGILTHFELRDRSCGGRRLRSG
jgi:hypothetical protein